MMHVIVNQSETVSLVAHAHPCVLEICTSVGHVGGCSGQRGVCSQKDFNINNMELVWVHTRGHWAKWRCKTCKESVKASDGNTTNLFNHLKRRHPKQYAESLAAKAKKATATPPAAAPKQQSLTDAFSKLSPYDRGSKRWNNVTEAIAFHLAKDLRRLQTVEGIGFNKMIKVLDPRYELPSRKFFSQTAIPRMYGECREKIAKNIKHLQFCHNKWSLVQSHFWTITEFNYTLHQRPMGAV